MNIRVNLNTNIADGSEVVFRSPADCSQVTGLVIYHNGGKTEFAFADAHGNNVGDIDHLFAENAVVKVILDVTARMAFVQNADTNAYIERTFVKTINGQAPDKNGNVEIAISEGISGVVGDGKTDVTEAIQKAINENDSVYLPDGTYLITAPLNFAQNGVQFRCEGTIKYTGAECAVRSEGRNQKIYIHKISAPSGTALLVESRTSKVTVNDYTVDDIYAGVNGVHVKVPEDASAGTAITYCNFRLGHVYAKNADSSIKTHSILLECHRSDSYINENHFWATKVTGANVGIKLYSADECSIHGGCGVNDTVFHTGSLEGLTGDATIVLHRTSGNLFERFRCSSAENSVKYTFVFEGLCEKNILMPNNARIEEIDCSGIHEDSFGNIFRGTFVKADTYRVNNSGDDIVLDGKGWCYHSNADKVKSLTKVRLGDKLVIESSIFEERDSNGVITKAGELPSNLYVNDGELKGLDVVIGPQYSNREFASKGIPLSIYCLNKSSCPKRFLDENGDVVLDNSDGQLVGKWVTVQCVGYNGNSYKYDDQGNVTSGVGYHYVWSVTVRDENPLTLRASIEELGKRVPQKVSELVNDANYLTDQSLAGYAKTTDIPTRPSQVGADAVGTASSAISAHNTSDTAHGDIRSQLEALANRITAVLDSDDSTLDQLSEIVTYIKSNKELLDAVTTAKVNVTDIIDNLVTNVSNKPLSASQGTVLKGLIDSLNTNKLDTSKLTEAIRTALAEAKASGAFNGAPGHTPVKGTDYFTPADKEELVSSVIASLPKYNGEVV
jgi:hypothetical protein